MCHLKVVMCELLNSPPTTGKAGGVGQLDKQTKNFRKKEKYIFWVGLKNVATFPLAPLLHFSRGQISDNLCLFSVRNKWITQIFGPIYWLDFTWGQFFTWNEAVEEEPLSIS